jgi:DNA-binding transcriptional ArsR family regulator
MSQRSSSRSARSRQAHARIFAALGDGTRLALVAELADGEPHSIAQLTAGFRLTRQAITKHLRVLQGVGLVRCKRTGRESRFEFNPQPIQEMKQYLDLVSAQWDQTLSRLKAFVEK